MSTEGEKMEDPYGVIVHFSTELLADLGEWSQPVQVKIVETDGIDSYDMTFRMVEEPGAAP